MSLEKNKRLNRIRDRRYDELSRAALKLFGSKGFTATKISDITSSVNLSHGLFYHYFRSKEDVYVSIVNDVLDLFLETVSEISQRDESAWEQLVWFTEQTYATSLEDSFYRRVILLQAFNTEHISDEVKQSMKVKYKKAVRKIGTIIATAQKEGTWTEGDPMDLAVYYLSLTHGLTLWNVKGVYPIDVSVDKIMRMFQS